MVCFAKAYGILANTFSSSDNIVGEQCCPFGVVCENHRVAQYVGDVHLHIHFGELVNVPADSLDSPSSCQSPDISFGDRFNFFDWPFELLFVLIPSLPSHEADPLDRLGLRLSFWRHEDFNLNTNI